MCADKCPHCSKPIYREELEYHRHHTLANFSSEYQADTIKRYFDAGLVDGGFVYWKLCWYCDLVVNPVPVHSTDSAITLPAWLLNTNESAATVPNLEGITL